MELLQGDNIKAFIQRHTISQDDFKSLGLQLASAVSYLHDDMQICHRDLNPENVIISRQEDGALKLSLIDFNVSRSYK
jgi:inhibitor of nuclear factor kappa-B kinase subunit beta